MFSDFDVQYREDAGDAGLCLVCPFFEASRAAFKFLSANCR